MHIIRGHIVVYSRGRDAGHVMTRLSRSIRELEGKGYTCEAVAVWAATLPGDRFAWSAQAVLQNPETDVPAVASPVEVEAK